MDYIKVVFSSLFSLFMLFLSTKIIGNKQMSQLNMFDYINGITIGSIAADMAINVDNNILFPVIAILVYSLLIFSISFFGSKSIILRRFLTGRSLILMDKGKMFKENFKISKIDLNEFFTQCRINGYYNINDIETAIIEQNGVISFMPRSSARPANTKDLNVIPGPERPFYCIISDGNILYENLRASGLERKKLDAELSSRRLSVAKVFAALTDGDTLQIYTDSPVQLNNDISQ